MSPNRPWPLAALVTVALIGAGCSSGSAENGATTAASTRSKAMKFAACMRDNGVGEFPDPESSGDLTIDGILNGSSLDPSSAVWKQAIRACKDLQPPGFTGRRRNSAQQDHALEFARCIRENGVKDFPDPTPGEPLVDTNRIPSSATSAGMTILNAAMQTCGDAAAKAIGRQP